MPLTARQFASLEFKDQLALIYGQFSAEPLSRNQFNNLDTLNDKITAIYLEIGTPRLSRYEFSLLSRNEQWAEIYVALGGTKNRQAIISYDRASQLANIYRTLPDPTLSIRQFINLDQDMQLAHIYLGFSRLAAEEELAPPINTVAPVASGGPQVGVQSTTTDGTWVPDGTKSYMWEVSDDGISGWENHSGGDAETNTITPDAGMETKYIRCKVTATNADGFAMEPSNILGPITAA